MKFEDVKRDITKSLNSKVNSMQEPVSLVDGFITIVASPTLEEPLYGMTIPLVALFGKESGQLFFFAAKPHLKES